MVDPKTGDLSSVFDRINQREILSGAGNQLQAFADQHKYWDAWNIDPDYEQHPLPPSQLQAMQWIDRGAICQRLRVIRTIANSTFQQDYVLEVGSPLLRIETIADWQDYHIILKAAFPLAAEANHATYEIPCGAIDRPTHSDDPMQQAKWEVPALRWADLAGVSVLNDCKYAYDSKPNQLRLTLLRGSCWPDPHADLGPHAFTYALYPHAESWQQAQTVRHGYALNQPLQVVQPSRSTANSAQSLPAVGSLLGLQSENLVLMAFKPCEDDPAQWLLRCYEAQGRSATLDLASDLGMKLVDRVDVLERSTCDRPSPDAESVATVIAPWQIASFVTVSLLNFSN